MRIIVSFIQGSHTYIPETNHVPRGYIVTAILSLLFIIIIINCILVFCLAFFSLALSYGTCVCADYEVDIKAHHHHVREGLGAFPVP